MSWREVMLLLANRRLTGHTTLEGLLAPYVIDSRFANSYCRTVLTEQVRRVSSALFGHKYRLELLAALVAAGDEGVCVTELARDVGVAASVFYPPLRLLAETGLVRRVGPSTDHDRKVFYAATEHEAWTGLRRVVQDLAVTASTPDAASTATR